MRFKELKKLLNLELFYFSLLVHLSSRQVYAHKGIYSQHLSDAKIVIPRKVNHIGEHVSHNLDHYHEKYNSSSNSSGSDEIYLLHYQIDVSNETLHLELNPHSYFMAPAMIIERHKRDTRTRHKPRKNTNCFYHGQVRGHQGSNVAISACNGIAGHIRTINGEYFVEPSKEHKLSPKGHPHVVFQRNDVENKGYQKLSQKLKKRRKNKKRAINNCGTKEPRLHTETRIEWQPQGKFIIQGGRRVRQFHQRRKLSQQQHQNDSTFVSMHNYQTQEKRGVNQNHHKKPHHREKRSISSPRHVEALVVADRTMVAFHDDVETYLLTIMNMVSSLYKDPSIGNNIHVVVVRMIILHEGTPYDSELNLTENAQRNLESFCSWQHKLNSEKEDDPYHHDVAILITRKDICGHDCMTLGLANVGGMCKPRKSCSVNEDNGIMLSHTVAHELGHNFGMYHDTLKIGCHGRVGPIVHIMTPKFGADTIQVTWSNCSRKYITHFLDQGLGKCLDDPPSEDIGFQYPELPPGAMYNAELQCRLQFNLTDDDVHVCSAPHEICSQLWCQVNGECVTTLQPTAPGTNCGKHKWCQNAECVPIEDIPTPVDGGWGNWSDWNECSRSCGGGVSIQSRQCDNPPPANGGSFCIGERKRYMICNKQSCLEMEPSFRAIQCAKFNNESYNGEKYNWLPHFDRYNPCKLYCTDADDSVIANWADSVADGTPCKIGTNNMCIAGICKKVGCDWIVDSDKAEDRCGVCGGSDEDCEIIKEEYTSPFNITDGYVEIITIPKGSRHILIEEMVSSPSYLSVGKTNSSKYYLNGHRYISLPGEFLIGDAESLYDREDEKESIRIPGPIQNTVTVYVIVRGGHKNDGIRYEFTLPAKHTASVLTYTWKLGDWTACSATCGGGVQHRTPFCYENGQMIVDDELCWSNDEKQRPHEIDRVCNKEHCPTYWWSGPWQNCPVPCRKKHNAEPHRRRSVMCLNQNEIVLPDALCKDATRPIETEPCGTSIPFCNFDDENEIEDSDPLLKMYPL